MTKTTSVLSLLFAVGLLFATDAQAQSVTPPACADGLLGAASPTFEGDKHRLWYRRFWTGECAPQLGFCMSGRPNWSQAVDTVAQRAAPAARAALVARACRVGVKVGAEWARENNVRRINTNDVQRYGERVQQPGDPAVALSEIEQQADAKLNGR